MSGPCRTDGRTPNGGSMRPVLLKRLVDVAPESVETPPATTRPHLVPAVTSGIGHRSPHLPGTRYGIGAIRIQATDVGFTLRANRGRFDVVLLDTDNGPAAFTAADNAGLYDNAGVAAAFAALRPGGTLAVWSAWDDRKFEQRLRFHGFLRGSREGTRPPPQRRAAPHHLRRVQEPQWPSVSARARPTRSDCVAPSARRP